MTSNTVTKNKTVSPCVKLCIIHQETQLCLGCFRSLNEISSWKSYNEEEKQSILGKLNERETLLNNRPRKGRKKRLRNSLIKKT